MSGYILKFKAPSHNRYNRESPVSRDLLWGATPTSGRLSLTKTIQLVKSLKFSLFLGTQFATARSSFNLIPQRCCLAPISLFAQNLFCHKTR